MALYGCMSAGPRLILLIGLPGSGKSYLADQLKQMYSASGGDIAIVSTDAIRAALFGDAAIQGSWLLVWREVERQFQQAAQPACPRDATLYDATHTRRQHRREAVALARTTGFRHITGIWLDTPLAVCLERNRQRDRQVPEAVIHKMHRQLCGAPPSLSDGLDCLRRYTAFSGNLGSGHEERG